MKKQNLLLGVLLVGCGVESEVQQSPIIGGIVERGRPYVVAVGSSFDGPFCTGTLISTRTVITAGHCFGGINRVFVGTNGFSPELSLTVQTEQRHPSFNNNTLANDLAILKLAQDAPLQPAPLLRATMDDSPTFIGPDFIFVGYGDSNSNGGGFGTKRVVDFPIDEVGPGNVGGTPGSIDATQFYYRISGKQTCFGDSGGPSFFVDGRVERHAGVTSFGDFNCSFDGVNARTDQPTINNFIQSRIETFEAGNPCKSDGSCNESCNTNGDVMDADCQELHCEADGLCALACVMPIDPDCFDADVNRCLDDGTCDPTCPALDEDCGPLCSAGNTCVRACDTPDPDCVAGLCGDGVLNLDEQCDDANDNNLDGCNSSCKIPGCGDGVVAGDEACDDGNLTREDGCDDVCQIEGCGDGIIQAGLGETCDDSNAEDSDGCSSDCTVELDFSGGSCSIAPAPNSARSFFLFGLFLGAFLWRRRVKSQP